MGVDTTSNAKRSPAKPAGAQWLAPLALAQTLALVFLGYSVSDLGAKTDRLARVAALNAALPAAPAATTQFAAASPAEVRNIVREEIARLGGQPAEIAQNQGAAQLPALTQAAPAASLGEVRRDLEAHIARGRMTSVEVEQFLTRAAELPPAERERMMRKFQAAINSGKLDARL